MAKYAILKQVGQTITTTESTVSWDNAVEVGGEWWNSANPTRLTVPAGVSFIELMFTALASGTAVSTDILIRIRVNGVDTFTVIIDRKFYCEMNYSLGVYAVSPGDYFEIRLDRFTGSDRTLETDFTALSAFDVTDIEGAVAARLTSDTNINAQTELSWTVDADTEGTHNGTGTFTVPSNISAARVCLSGRNTVFNSNNTTYEVHVNGTAVRRTRTSVDGWSPGVDFGLIPVSPGDTITIEAQCAVATLESDFTRLGIQWLGDVTASPPLPGDYVAGFHVTRAATSGLVDGAAITYDNVRLDDGVGISAPLTEITVPAGVSAVVTGAHTRDASSGSTYWELAIQKNGADEVRNAWHDANYNTGIVNGVFPVTEGDVIRVVLRANSGTNTSVCDWWGKFYA